MLDDYKSKALEVTLRILRKMGFNEQAKSLKRRMKRKLHMGVPGHRQTHPSPAGLVPAVTTDIEPCPVPAVSGPDVSFKLRDKLGKRCERIFEGVVRQPAQLSKVYTEVFLTQGRYGSVNNEHEVWNIEAETKKTLSEEVPVECNRIFQPLPGQEYDVRSVLTKGIAGIGKTVVVQKFILDWAKGEANTDIHLIFPLPFRELKKMEGKKFSLLELIEHYHPEMKACGTVELNSSKVMFIFDGLDECQLPLDFCENETWSAVDKALESPNGHLDLFLRFLLGLSLDNQGLLGGLLLQTENSSQSIMETVRYIKQKISKSPSPGRTINLFHCLNELNDHSLVEEIQDYLHSNSLSNQKLSPDQCSALAYVLLMSEKEVEVLDLRMYNSTQAGYRRLLPVLKHSKAALLQYCDLTPGICDLVNLVLQSPTSLLRELDLGYNSKLGDKGGRLLCTGLQTPQCRLQTLGLGHCSLTAEDPSCKLENLIVDHGGEFRLKPGMRKYGCYLTFDPSTAAENVFLSEGDRRVCREQRKGESQYTPPVLCTEALNGRCYWEAEWEGGIMDVGMAYAGITRPLGEDDQSWILSCDPEVIRAVHDNKTSFRMRTSFQHRVGVYLDWPNGTLAFYKISSKGPIHLHTFHTTFTQPLYPAFALCLGFSLSLCQLD
ncbi:hypothetical protein AAFF_G00323560 [Aldrovandia affinis]|uniref:NACHT, LRR and PYD domains-containing protein 12-like n=1 Tax=Aldrovandia affinis TaxID=143900 RepID=A0AAD7VZK9_9TELE|nr:hypothetical protein AAFF_G00323560 [Aldrovandia affinis]